MLNELTERSGEDQLDGMLDAIGLRVAVEIAKRRPRLKPPISARPEIASAQ
jgi:hypothetical protein